MASGSVRYSFGSGADQAGTGRGRRAVPSIETDPFETVGWPPFAGQIATPATPQASVSTRPPPLKCGSIGPGNWSTSCR